MPRRGYRKGVMDGKVPRPHVIKSRTGTGTYHRLHHEATVRSMTFSALVAAILDAHAAHTRLSLPHPRPIPDADRRQLDRIGNNVNQIAHQANLMRLPHIQKQAQAVLAKLETLLDGMS